MISMSEITEVKYLKKYKCPEIDDLSELIGEFIQYWGFKSIHGKIWIHLYLSTEPLDAKALMNRLNISKALVSISLRDLMLYDVVLEDMVSSEGTKTYTANTDVKGVIERVLRGREKIMMGKIKGSFQNLKDAPASELAAMGVQTKRVRELEKLITKGDQMLATVMAII